MAISVRSPVSQPNHPSIPRCASKEKIPKAARPLPNTIKEIAIFFISLSVCWLLAVRSLPFGLAALHLLFGDRKSLTNGIAEAFGFCVAGDRRCG